MIKYIKPKQEDILEKEIELTMQIKDVLALAMLLGHTNNRTRVELMKESFLAGTIDIDKCNINISDMSTELAKTYVVLEDIIKDYKIE